MTETLQPTGTTDTPELTDRQKNHSRRWWILGVLGLAQLMVVLDDTIVNIALPTAQHALKFSNADRQWVVTGYALAFGSLLLLGGRLGDILGRKRARTTRPDRVRRRLGPRRVLDRLHHAPRRPVRPGCLRGAAGPLGPVAADDDVHRPKERNRAFAIYGAIAGAGGAIGLFLGRGPHLLRVVALDALRQPGLRRGRLRRRPLRS